MSHTKTQGVWIVCTDRQDSSSLFSGLELSGVNGLVLHMNHQQLHAYRELHKEYGMPIVSIHEEEQPLESEKLFTISEYVGPLSSAYWEIRLKRFNGVWMPVSWIMTMIS